MSAVPLFSVFYLSSTVWIYTVAGALTHRLPENVSAYDKNVKPGLHTEVAISLYINRISGVDENKEEISIDAFLQVTWEDPRLAIPDAELVNLTKEYVELTPTEQKTVWVPDLYIRQLREMKVMTLFEEISKLRLYKNSTLVLTKGATIIFKCDMDFVLYPLDVQTCPVDFSSCWYRGEKRWLHYSSPRTWLKPRNHEADCFFCAVQVGHGKAITIYPDLPSSAAPKLRETGLENPIRKLPEAVLSSSTLESESVPSVAVSEYRIAEVRSPHYPNQKEIDDLVRDLSLTKANAELLISRLKEWELLDGDVKITTQRKRHEPYSSFFTYKDGLCFCHDVGGLFDEMGLKHEPKEWRLFIDSSSKSLKAVLLHNGNEHPSIPVAHSKLLKENYDSTKLLMDSLHYSKYCWEVIGDFKMIAFLMGLQDKYSDKEMRFRWKNDNGLSFPNDFTDGFFRLPKYVVSFNTEREPKMIHYGEDNHSSAHLEIVLSREVKSYLLENYLPSTLFVSMSWGSFVVVPEIVPGRMVLLVTTLLSLITMFDTVRNNSPDALELKCLEVWLISCTLFVFFALMEYFIVLFGIRYDKHWRVAAKAHHVHIAPPVQLQSTLSVSQNTVETPMNSSHTPKRENGLESTGLKVTGTNKVQPQEADSSKVSSIGNLSGNFQNTQHVTSVMTRRRFRNVADVALMYAGSQRGRLDQISLIIFPLSFLIFTIAYWTMYISESNIKKKM